MRAAFGLALERSLMDVSLGLVINCRGTLKLANSSRRTISGVFNTNRNFVYNTFASSMKHIDGWIMADLGWQAQTRV